MTSQPFHFFIVGAQRSGTTFLYKALASHPEIFMAKPLRPEPKYFLYEENVLRGKDYYLEQHFPKTTTECFFGEKSTSYFEYEVVARRIKKWFPDSKIIIILREPIDRAISNYSFSKDNGIETLSITEAFKREPERIDQFDSRKFSASPFAYLQRGKYIEYLMKYIKFFPRDQIKILIFEELMANAEASVNGVLDFLGATLPIQDAALHNSSNASYRSGISITPNLMEYLQFYFSESNKALEEFLGREISVWNFSRVPLSNS